MEFRWGHETSQHAESLNRALKPQRQEVAFKQSNLLWDYEMTKFYEKGKLANSLSTPFPPNIMAKLKRIEEKALHLIADASSDNDCRITDHLGRQFLVEFCPQWKCSCGDFQDTLYPCIHAWRACTKLHKRHFNFVSPFYSTATFQATYAVPIPAIVHTDLLPNTNCGEPLKRRQRGRPSEKQRPQFAEEDGIRRPRRCQECKELGHDRRTCPVLDAMRAQSRGKGPTEGSDREDSGNSAGEDGGGRPRVQRSTRHVAAESSDSEKEPDEDFTLSAIHARREAYRSDDGIFVDGSDADEFRLGESSGDEGQYDAPAQREEAVIPEEILDVGPSQLFSQPSQSTADAELGMTFTELLATMSSRGN